MLLLQRPILGNWCLMLTYFVCFQMKYGSGSFNFWNITVLHFWKALLFTSFPTQQRLHLTGLFSPDLTFWCCCSYYPVFSLVSHDSLFSALAAYFGLSFVNDNWPFFLDCLSKHRCCSECPGNLGKLIPGHINLPRIGIGVLRILKSASLTFSGKLSRSSHFSCLPFTLGWPTKHFKLSISQILSF